MSEPSGQEQKPNRTLIAEDKNMQLYRRQHGLRPGNGPPRREESEVSDGRRNPR